MKKKLFAATAAAIAAIAFWRRKTIKDDAAKVTQASKGAAAKATEASKGVVAKATEAGKGAAAKATEAGKGAAAKATDRVRGRGTTDSGEGMPPVETLDLRNDGESVPSAPSTTT